MGNFKGKLPQGTRILFEESGFQAVATEIGFTGISREAVETTDLSNVDWKTFIPSKVADPGGVSLSIRYKPGLEPPVIGSAERVRIEMPEEQPILVTAFVTDFSFTAGGEELIGASVTLKISGEPEGL